MSLADNPYIGVEPRYNVLKRQGYLGLILEKDLVFYKVDDKKKRLQSMPLLTRDKIILVLFEECRCNNLLSAY